MRKAFLIEFMNFRMSSLGETVAERPEHEMKSVRLTDNLLCSINKKLKSMDKAYRKQRFEASEENEDPLPFTEVAYRKQPALSQTQLAVMHKTLFSSSTIAIFKDYSKQELVEDLEHWCVYIKRDARNHFFVF